MAEQRLDIILRAVDQYSAEFDRAQQKASALQQRTGEGAAGQVGAVARNANLGPAARIVGQFREVFDSENQVNALMQARNALTRELLAANREILRVQQLGTTSVAEAAALEKQRLALADMYRGKLAEADRLIAEQSKVGKLGQIGLTLGIMGVVAGQLSATAQQVRQITDQLRATDATTGEWIDKLTRAVPVLGSIWSAGRDIREIFTGEQATANEYLRIQQSTQRVVEGSVAAYKLHLDALDALRDKAKQYQEELNRLSLGPAEVARVEQGDRAEKRANSVDSDIDAQIKASGERSKALLDQLKSDRQAAVGLLDSMLDQNAWGIVTDEQVAEARATIENLDRLIVSEQQARQDREAALESERLRLQADAAALASAEAVELQKRQADAVREIHQGVAEEQRRLNRETARESMEDQGQALAAEIDRINEASEARIAAINEARRKAAEAIGVERLPVGDPARANVDAIFDQAVRDEQGRRQQAVGTATAEDAETRAKEQSETARTLLAIEQQRLGIAAQGDTAEARAARHAADRLALRQQFFDLERQLQAIANDQLATDEQRAEAQRRLNLLAGERTQAENNLALQQRDRDAADIRQAVEALQRPSATNAQRFGRGPASDAQDAVRRQFESGRSQQADPAAEAVASLDRTLDIKLDTFQARMVEMFERLMMAQRENTNDVEYI